MNNSDNSPDSLILRNESVSSESVLPIVTTPVAVPRAKVHLISGGIAGLVSAITLQPLDLLKTRLQQQHQIENKYVRTTITKEIKKLTQLKDLWRGALPSTLRTSIGAGLYFTTLSHLRTSLATYKSTTTTSTTSILPKLSPLENLSIGFIARATVGFVTMPVTVVKTRYESNIYNYRSILDSVVGIYKNDDITSKGSFRNFFKGSVATLARDCPYAGLYVLFYESFKNEILPTLVPASSDNSTNNNGAQIINSSAAVLAASLSTTITAPFDAIKTRLQLSDVKPGQQQKSILQITKILVNEEGGVGNLFRGLSLRLGRKAISAGISWCIYEELIKSTLFSPSKFS